MLNMKKSWCPKFILACTWLILSSVSSYAGIQTAKGFFDKPALGARGIADKALFDAGLDRVDARLGKEIWVGDPNYGATLQTALTAIGSSTPVILRLPAGTHSIATDLTVPANVTLKPERGAILAVATTKTLTINGPLESGPYQIFSCTGTGKVVFGPGAIKEVHPEWWGGKADNATDSGTAINAAITAASTGIVQLLQGTYRTSVPILGTAARSIRGTGRQKTYIKPLAGWATADYLLKFVGNSGAKLNSFDLRDLCLDGEDNTALTGGLSLKWCYNVTLERVDVQFINNDAAVGVNLDDCFMVTAKDCQAMLGHTAGSQGRSGWRVMGTPATGENVSQITFIACYGKFVKNYGFELAESKGTDGVLIEQCGMTNNEGAGVFVGKYNRNVDIKLNHIEYVSYTGATPAYGVYADGAVAEGARNIRINNNFVLHEAGVAITNIYATNCDRLEIDKNTFYVASGTNAVTNIPTGTVRRINWGANVIYGIAAFTGDDPSLTAFANADTTPSVYIGGTKRRHHFKTANAGATSITAFDNGTEGQEILVYFGDSNTTLVNSDTLRLRDRMNFTGAEQDVLTFVAITTQWGLRWIETGRSVTRVPKGTTANRPASAAVGAMYLDTTLDADGLPVFWNGTKWIKADGTDG